MTTNGDYVVLPVTDTEARERQFVAEIESLRAQLANARKALEFIAEGYDNHDINHVDYRVKVYQVATETLEEIA